ncbi:hypothetical protein Efla_002769 [Eimeria flavescens]
MQLLRLQLISPGTKSRDNKTERRRVPAAGSSLPAPPLQQQQQPATAAAAAAEGAEAVALAKLFCGLLNAADEAASEAGCVLILAQAQEEMAPQKYYTVGVSNKFAAFGADSDASSDDGEVILAAPPPVLADQQQQAPHAAAASRKKEQQQQQQQQHSPQRERQGRPPRGGGLFFFFLLQHHDHEDDSSFSSLSVCMERRSLLLLVGGISSGVPLLLLPIPLAEFLCGSSWCFPSFLCPAAAAAAAGLPTGCGCSVASASSPRAVRFACMHACWGLLLLLPCVLHAGRGGLGGEGRGAFRGARGRADFAAEAPEETYGIQVLPEDGDNAHRRRGGFRGRRGGGGPPGASGGGPSHYPRREFDRHSGTGRSHEAKKHGAGGHNWGQNDSENHFQKSDSLLAEEKAIKEEGAQEPRETAEEGEEKEGAPAAAVEEEEPTMDLDTYKKMQAEKRANLPTFVSASASSKPIETDKELAAQGYVRLTKGGDEEAEESHEESPNTREDRPKKKSINLYEYVHIEGGRVPSFGRRGGRGGSRGGREERGRRGGAPGGAPANRAPRSRESAPDLKDTQAFPTLGAR